MNTLTLFGQFAKVQQTVHVMLLRRTSRVLAKYKHQWSTLTDGTQFLNVNAENGTRSPPSIQFRSGSYHLLETSQYVFGRVHTPASHQALHMSKDGAFLVREYFGLYRTAESK